MKKFLSVLIALILVLSMFSVTVVAFADDDNQADGETAHGPIDFKAEIFKEAVYDKFALHIEMSETFMLDTDWLYDAELVRSIFPGINWFAWPKEDYDDETPTATLKYSTDDPNGIYTGYYCEVEDKFFEESELVEGKCPNYQDGEHENNGAVEEKTLPKYEDTDYHVTQHVKLADAPKVAVEGKQFDGWLISYDSQPDWREGRLYAAGEEIAMPEDEVTVTAKWSDVEEDEDDGEEGEETAKVNEEEDANIPEDKIYVLYSDASSDPKAEMKDWGYSSITSTINVTSEGWWSFRFAVVDGYADNTTFSFDNVLITTYANVEKAIEDGETNEENLLKLDYTLKGYTGDVTHPVIDLSQSMKDKAEEGLTVGKTYSISTTLETTDASSVSVTYEVYKKVGASVAGADEDGWLLIYDSTQKSGERVTEGYDNCITESGVITPLASDVTGEAIYKIVYSAKDSNGFFGVETAESTEEFHPTLMLKVNAASGDVDKEVEAWKIVLYVIAGLAAVGIVVLLFIKPKEAKVDDARYNRNANADGDDSDKKSE